MRLRNMATFMVLGRGVVGDGDGIALRTVGALSIGGTAVAGEPIQALMMCWRSGPGTDSKLSYWLVWPLEVTRIWMPSRFAATIGVGKVIADGVGELVAGSGGQIMSGGVGEAAGFGGAPCAARASISASNCASRVFASLFESRAMVFPSGMGLSCAS